MGRNKLLVVVTLILLATFANKAGLAADKLKVGTSYKLAPTYYLPVLAAEERGFWKENGLEVEYVPFFGGAPLYQAVASGDVKVGLSVTSSQVHAISSGVPITIIAELSPSEPFAIWVLPGSPLKEPKALKGAKIGIVRSGSADHILGRVAVRALGLEKDVRFISLGGFREKLAGLKAKAVDAIVEGHSAIPNLWAEGEMRVLVTVDDYLPKEWIGNSFFAHKDLIRLSPDVVRRALKAGLEAVKFVRDNQAWSLTKIKEVSGYSDQVAKFTYDKVVSFTKDGKIDPRAIENVKNFLVEYELIPKEKAPATSELFTTRFLE